MKTSVWVTVTAALVLFILATPSLACEGCTQTDWQWVSTSEVADTGVLHTTWEAQRPPYGPYDKIALHRFVYRGGDWGKYPRPGKVLFHLPGTWDTAWKGITDPAYENHVFFALNGYAVYSMDYRVSYLPELPQEGFDSSSTEAWTYGAFREDIKACIEKAKKLSHTRKVFLSGFSRGGTQMWIYASKYGEADLKGLIGLDGGAPYASPAAPRTETEYQAAMDAFLASQAPRLSPSTTYEGYNRIQFAGILPGSTHVPGYGSLEDCLYDSDYYELYGPPPQGTNLDTISDLMAYFYNYAWNERFGGIQDFGVLTNYYEGMMDQSTLIRAEAGMEFYWPAVQNVEQESDPGYGDNIADIDLPVLFFGGILGCGYEGSRCPPDGPFKCASEDVSVVTLPHFGHMDVMWGTQSLEQVKQPMLEWMDAHARSNGRYRHFRSR